MTYNNRDFATGIHFNQEDKDQRNPDNNDEQKRKLSLSHEKMIEEEEAHQFGIHHSQIEFDNIFDEEAATQTQTLAPGTSQQMIEEHYAFDGDKPSIQNSPDDIDDFVEEGTATQTKEPIPNNLDTINLSDKTQEASPKEDALPNEELENIKVTHQDGDGESLDDDDESFDFQDADDEGADYFHSANADDKDSSDQVFEDHDQVMSLTEIDTSHHSSLPKVTVSPISEDLPIVNSTVAVLPPTSATTDAIANTNLGLGTYTIILVAGGSFVIVGLLACLVARLVARRRHSKHVKQEVFKCIEDFDSKDILLTKALTGGWHGTYKELSQYLSAENLHDTESDDSDNNDDDMYVDEYHTSRDCYQSEDDMIVFMEEGEDILVADRNIYFSTDDYYSDSDDDEIYFAADDNLFSPTGVL